MKSFPVARPAIGAAEIRAVTRVLKSGNLSLGPELKAFEHEFARAAGTREACAVSSGTAGLHLALIAAGVGPGDEVITSPFSFIASSNAILYVGATPVFVDVDPVTYNLDPARITRAITKRTKAILVVHIFGQPAEMWPIMKIAREHRLKVIEDACEAIGATYHGKNVGTFGESGVFAFYPNKQMTTGEGGMLVTNSRRVSDLCRSLANQGRAKDMQWLDHKVLGYNYRMDEMSAALGRVQLARLTQFIAARRQIARWYGEALAPCAEMIGAPRLAPNRTHTYFVYVVQILKPGVSRDEVIRGLRDAGVQTKPYLPSIHLFTFYRRRFGFRKGDFPVSEALSDRSLALPISVVLARRDVYVIVSRLLKVMGTQ